MLGILTAVVLSCWSLSVYDGDTIRCDGQLMRLLGDGEPFVSGIDAPELKTYRCEHEADLAKKARQRLKELLFTPGVTIEHSGVLDKKDGRPLVRIRMPDGRTAESILLYGSLGIIWIPTRKLA